LQNRGPGITWRALVGVDTGAVLLIRALVHEPDNHPDESPVEPRLAEGVIDLALDMVGSPSRCAILFRR
jgi:hypothetical protein